MIDKKESREVLFSEIAGDTHYTITKGVFYIADFMADMSAFRVMKHIKYQKPIVEYVFKKAQAEIILKDLMKA